MTDPPKKKHRSKPRSEVVRLTLSQQSDKAEAQRHKAAAHLAEARQTVAAGIAPNATAHSAYFAMEFAAAAVLLVNGGVDKFGDVPASHAHIIEHFAKLIEKQAPELAVLVEAIRRAQVDRLLGDYDTSGSLSHAQAADVLRSAEDFVSQCQSRWPIAKR